MKRYVIKNCPCAVNDMFCKENRFFCYHPKLQVGSLCQDCTDCLLKRIVNECRNELEKRNAYSVSIHYDFAREILKFVEIEEVDE